MKLLLFDVDLTLINTAGAGRCSMTLAFEKLFGSSNGLEKVDFAGRTDRAIFKDALRFHQLSWQETIEQEFKQHYFTNLQIEIKKPHKNKRIELGVPELLNLLSARADIKLGLLTGNWREGARIKLEHFNLQHFFTLGAYADDAELRSELPRFAVQRLTAQIGEEIDFKDVFIIGDTPLDVACARPFGARSIAVATGLFNYEHLQASQPDYLFHDLSDSGKFLQIIDA